MTDIETTESPAEPFLKRVLKRIANRAVDYSVRRSPLHSIDAGVSQINEVLRAANSADSLADIGQKLQTLRYIEVHVQRINQRLVDIVAASSAFQFPNPNVRLQTGYPVAITSDDHKFPRGTAFDDTRYPRFSVKAEAVLGKDIKLLDIGCSGGGIVFDFLKRGHFAIGLEGSDFCFLNQRGHWSIIPNHLFTCDATKPYSLISVNDNSQIKFDLISAWEVLEHIHEADFEQFFGNIRRHLRLGGLFVASVATFEDYDPVTGAVWHVTVKPREWWEKKIRAYGLAPVQTAFVTHDFPRGSGNPTATDWDAQASPHFGFHLVAEAV